MSPAQTEANRITEPSILAASPVFERPGYLPCRVVLRSDHNGYVTHMQSFMQDEKNPAIWSRSFCWGHYFSDRDGPGALMRSWADFVQRSTGYLTETHGSIEDDGERQVGSVPGRDRGAV